MPRGLCPPRFAVSLFGFAVSDSTNIKVRVLLILQLENRLDIVKYLWSVIEKNIQNNVRINKNSFHLTPLVRLIISSVVILTLAIPLNLRNFPAFFVRPSRFTR